MPPGYASSYARARLPSPMQQRLPKYRRTAASRQAVARRRITERDLMLIETIARFRLVPSSLLVRLIPGDRSATYEHLQTLYHRELVNRFHLPRTGPANEFVYYLDNPRAIELLADFERDTSQLDLAEIKRNRANAYQRVNDPHVPDEEKPSLLFVRHELMITRFQACLELACATSRGAVKLVTFCRARSSLKHPLVAPKLERVTDEQGSEEWRETKEWEWLPHAPDAFFSRSLKCLVSAAGSAAPPAKYSIRCRWGRGTALPIRRREGRDVLNSRTRCTLWMNGAYICGHYGIPDQVGCLVTFLPASTERRVGAVGEAEKY